MTLYPSKFKIYRRFGEDVWGDLLRRKNFRLVSLLALLFRNLRSPTFRLRELFLPLVIQRQWNAASRRKRPPTLYKRQLTAKQRLQLYYRLLRDFQMKNLFREAFVRRGFVEDNFLALLETRLSSVLMRSLFFPTTFQARTFLLHGGVLVNGCPVDRPGFRLRGGDLLSFSIPQPTPYDSLPPPSHRGGRLSLYFRPSPSPSRSKRTRFLLGYPSYLEVDYSLRRVIFLHRPSPSEIFHPFESSISDLIAHYS